MPYRQNPYTQGPGGYGYPPPGAQGGVTGAPGAPGAPAVSGAPRTPRALAAPSPAYRAPLGGPLGGTPGGAGGRGVSGWLWAIGGAVAAAAIGASVMFATGAFSSAPRPDLKGYAYRDDLCAATSLTPFANAHYKAKPSTGTGAGAGPGSGSGSGSGPSGASSPPNPQHSGSRMNSMDSMWCNISLTADDAGTGDYPSTWIYNSVTLHKKADPAPEFADVYRAYEKQQTTVSYKVEPVTGLGDEAYLVTRNDASGGGKSTYVVLAVRDGWLTYQSTWSSYPTSSRTAKPPSSSELATMLETSAKETLKRLRG